MQPSQVGDWAETWVMAALIQRGHRLAIPYGQTRGVDLLVEKLSGRWVTVQIKTASRHKPSCGSRWRVQLTLGAKGKRWVYNSRDFDLLIAASPGDERLWLFRSSEVAGKGGIYIPAERGTRWWLLR